MGWEAIAALFVIITAFVLRGSPLGADTYYFFTTRWEALPIAAFVFNHVSMSTAIFVSAAITIITVAVLAYHDRKVIPLLVAFPLLFVYSFRLEDDQLAYPLIAFAVATIVTDHSDRAYLKALLITLPALFIWKGAYLFAGVLVAAWITRKINKTWAYSMFYATAVIVGVLFTAGFRSGLAEANPILALFFAPLIYLTRHTIDFKNHLVVAWLSLAGILYPKLLWTALPGLYLLAIEGWEKLPQDLRNTAMIAGVLGSIVAAFVLFPSPFLNPSEICPHLSAKEWGYGWWCIAHGYNVPYYGAPPTGTNELLGKCCPGAYSLAWLHLPQLR